MEMYDAVLNAPEIQAYKPQLEAQGLNLDKLVIDGITHVTEGIGNPQLQTVTRAVGLYLANELKACAMRKMAQSPGTTFFGKLWRNTIGKLFK